jgi:hypothetical protein
VVAENSGLEICIPLFKQKIIALCLSITRKQFTVDGIWKGAN